MTSEEIAAMAAMAGLVPVWDLPRANPQKDVEDFLRRAALCIKQAAEAGYKECRFQVGGIPNTPKRVMEAAIEPLKAFGYEARIIKVGGTTSTMPISVPMMRAPSFRTPDEEFLVVSGWGD